MGTIYRIGLLLAVIGALNWGLIGFLQYDLVADLFGTGSVLTRWIYALVGVGGVVSIPILFKRFEEEIDWGPAKRQMQMEAGEEPDFTQLDQEDK